MATPYDELDILNYLGIGGKALEETSQGGGAAPAVPTNPYEGLGIFGYIGDALGIGNRTLADTSQGDPTIIKDFRGAKPTNPYANLGASSDQLPPEIEPFQEVDYIDTGINPAMADYQMQQAVDSQAIQENVPEDYTGPMEQFQGVEQLDPGIDYSQAIDPTTVSPNPVIEAQAQQASTTASTQVEQQLRSGGMSQEEEKSIFDMIKSTGSQFGQAIEMGFDAFNKLSPSTKAALFGGAAAIWARSQGHKRMAGQIAAQTAGMWQGLKSQEEAQEFRAQQQEDAQAHARDMFRQNAEVQAQRAQAQGEQPALDPKLYREGDMQRAREQALQVIEKQDTSWFGGPSDEEKQMQANVLANQYVKAMGGDATKMAQIPFEDWLRSTQGQ